MASPSTQIVVEIADGDAPWLQCLVQGNRPVASNAVREASALKIQCFMRTVPSRKIARALRRDRAAMTIQRGYRESAARKLASKNFRDDLRRIVLFEYGAREHATLSTLPYHHRLHVAARRIQMLVRRFRAHRRFEERQRHRAAYCVQKALRSYRFRGHVHARQRTRAAEQQLATAAVAIQAIWRCFKAKRQFAVMKAQRAAEQTFAEEGKRLRNDTVVGEHSQLRAQLVAAKRRDEELNLLRDVLLMDNPNGKLVATSTKSTYITPVQRKREEAAPPETSKVVRGDLPSGRFVLTPHALEPGMDTVLLTEKQPTVELGNIRRVRAAADTVARQKMANKGPRMNPWREKQEVSLYMM